MDYYELVRGPFAAIAFAVLILGTVYRLANWLSMGKTSRMIYPGESLMGAARSVFHHTMPFGASYMRKRPVFTVVTILFHLSVLILPIFLLAHITLWFESYGLLWWNLGNNVADGMTIIVLIACIFFIGRRIIVKEVRQVSAISDYLLPAVVFISFLTGFLAFHQWGPYRPMLILHIICSEILIMLIPFSRLRHMIFFMFSRMYMGAEYGKVLGSKDW